MALLAVGENHRRRRLLHDLTAVHNHDVVRHLVDDAQIVGDEYNRSAVFSLKFVHQVQDLRLNGDVECRCRLVRNQDFRLTGKCHSNHNALTHTARKLVRILFQNRCGIGDLNSLEHLESLLRCLFFLHPLVNHKRLAKLAFYVENGVEAGHRLLEDNGYLVASDFAHIVYGDFGYILSVEQNFTAVNPAVFVKQSQNAHCLDAFAAARLADDTDRAPFVNRIRNSVYGFDDALLGTEESMQIFNF